MNDLFQEAKEVLVNAIGQNRIMALATKNSDGVASRTVNLYHFEENFYFVTEVDSNKYKQIEKSNQVALSVDAIQITGTAVLLAHPQAERNQEMTAHVEIELPQQFGRYRDRPEMRLIKIEPDRASYISLETGQGYAIDYPRAEAMAFSMG